MNQYDLETGLPENLNMADVDFQRIWDSCRSYSQLRADSDTVRAVMQYWATGVVVGLSLSKRLGLIETDREELLRQIGLWQAQVLDLVKDP